MKTLAYILVCCSICSVLTASDTHKIDTVQYKSRTYTFDFDYTQKNKYSIAQVNFCKKSDCFHKLKFIVAYASNLFRKTKPMIKRREIQYLFLAFNYSF